MKDQVDGLLDKGIAQSAVDEDLHYVNDYEHQHDGTEQLRIEHFGQYKGHDELDAFCAYAFEQSPNETAHYFTA